MFVCVVLFFSSLKIVQYIHKSSSCLYTYRARERGRESVCVGVEWGVVGVFQIVSFVLCRNCDESRQTFYCILNEEGSPPTLHSIVLLISPYRDNLNV